MRPTFRIARDLTSLDMQEYAGNPALKLPILRDAKGTWFGSLNICRQLARVSTQAASLVWPEALTTPLLANAQELVLQAMANEVTLIMSSIGKGGATEAGPLETKLRSSLDNSLRWLDDNCASVLAELPPERTFSYLEVTLFCLLTHLPFRQVCSVQQFSSLLAFCERFALRDSARQTEYRFD